MEAGGQLAWYPGPEYSFRAPGVDDIVELLDRKWFGSRSGQDWAESGLCISRSPYFPAKGLSDSDATASSGATPPSDEEQASAARARSQRHPVPPSLPRASRRTSWRFASPLLNFLGAGSNHGSGAEEPPPSPALGTWAGRQRIFVSEPAPRLTLSPENASGGSGELARSAGDEAASAASPARGVRGEELVRSEEGATFRPGQAAARLPPAEGALAAPTGAPDRGPERPKPKRAPLPAPFFNEEEDEVHAAWRWRFTRKWQQEQAKQFDPSYGKEEDNEDEWGAALGLMRQNGDLYGPGGNWAEEREHSRSSLPGGEAGESGAGSHSALAPSSSFASPMLLDTASSLPRPLAEEAAATKQLASVARKAQRLQRFQKEIERHVEARWAGARAGGADEAWVGARVPAVALDDKGAFSFVLARLSDDQGRRALVLRGRRGVPEAALRVQLADEVARGAQKLGLPCCRSHVLGGGSAVVSAADGGLHLTVRTMHAASDALVRSKADVARVAAALVQARNGTRGGPVTASVL